MKLKVVAPDPFNILSSTKYVLENAKHVEIVTENIRDIVKPITSLIKGGLEDPSVSFGTKGNFKDDSQLVLVEDSVNFCFWAEKNKPKWQVEYPKGKKNTGGWYGLVACFERAKENKIPILDANYLSRISDNEVKKLFQGISDTQIPLIEKRKENLNELGVKLIAKYEGQFENMIEEADNDFVKLVKLVIQTFKSFRDSTNYKGKKVFFYKRAQIVASDISYLAKYDERAKLKNLSALTAFADYKLPQIFREFGILKYADKLSQKVDNYQLIPAGSEEEIEIRSSTVWVVELLRQTIGKYSSPQIDNAVWLMSQDQKKLQKPYHRTYTIYY